MAIFHSYVSLPEGISKMIPVIEKNEAATHIFSLAILQLLGTNSGKDSLGDPAEAPRSDLEVVSWSVGQFIIKGFFWDFYGFFLGFFLGFF